ncbi:MAG: hypothetical protein QOD65_159 [Gaiellales bacterium]|jgi:hypothetical protein|nr:hypothetical protein [Gaiellales bacterium]MDX6597909.1 hypothetical protein [Gaiellales bacterium]
MGLFSRKKRDAAPADLPAKVPAAQDQAVITHLRLSDDEFGTTQEREAVFELEGRIANAAERVGCFHDGNAFGGGEVELFTYGPDADVLFGVIESSLRGFEVRPGSYAIKRYGRIEDPNVREERVELA